MKDSARAERAIEIAEMVLECYHSLAHCKLGKFILVRECESRICMSYTRDLDRLTPDLLNRVFDQILT